MTAALDGTGAAMQEAVVSSAPVSAPSPLSPYVSITLACRSEQDPVTAEVARTCKATEAGGYVYELAAFDRPAAGQGT